DNVHMRMFLLSSFVVVGVIATSAQAPTAPAKPPQGTTQPKPAPAPGAGMPITVTDPTGTTLSGIQVSVSGTTTRNGETNASGNLSVTGLMAGTYRLRFDGEKWISFEREVTLRAGQ